MGISLVKKYSQYLPVTAKTPLLSLGEGNTPLIKLEKISQQYNITAYAKYEGANPTGSFKDRGMVMAVSKAIEGGSKSIICASTGNTSAAAAAYAARAGIKSFVLIPEGKVALGKLAQAIVYGAKLIQIKGNFDDGMEIVKQIATTRTDICLVNSVNPYRIEGQKTAAFEIIDELGLAPDYHILPVGNAGNITAYWRGYSEYPQKPQLNMERASDPKKLPKMIGIQASGAAPFIAGKPIDNPETIATAIRIGHPQSWDKAIAAVKESQGFFASLSDDKILAAQLLLATDEGIFCEPASAASVAGLIHNLQQNTISAGSTVVCTLTGNGLKDPDIILHNTKESLALVDATTSAIEEIIHASK